MVGSSEQLRTTALHWKLAATFHLKLCTLALRTGISVGARTERRTTEYTEYTEGRHKAIRLLFCVFRVFCGYH